MKYTKKEIKALKVFAEYISCEQPYKDMKKTIYKNLGEYYKELPDSVFSNPPSRSLYHTSRSNRTADKLTESGIVSCTTLEGKEYIQDAWLFTSGDIWWRLKKRKAVDAKKLYRVSCEVGVCDEGAWLEDRVEREDEYILPQESVEVLSKKVVK